MLRYVLVYYNCSPAKFRLNSKIHIRRSHSNIPYDGNAGSSLSFALTRIISDSVEIYYKEIRISIQGFDIYAILNIQ